MVEYSNRLREDVQRHGFGWQGHGACVYSVVLGVWDLIIVFYGEIP